MSGTIFKYQQSHDYSIAEELKTKYRDHVATLERLGFSYNSLHQEILWPFSVILFFPVYLMMAKRDYLRVRSPLRITSYHLMYASVKEATFAYVFGLGCKFYTKFTDSTWLVSNTAQKMRDEKIIVVKRGYEGQPLPTEQVWQFHQKKVQELVAQGKQPDETLSFEEWLNVESKFDRSNLASFILTNLIWMALVVWAIYQLVSFVLFLVRVLR